jgi:5'-3' exonuclease
MLSDENGNPTAHLVGMFNRTIMLMEAGIKPVWIFEGTPPDLKNLVLQKRKSRRNDARDQILNPDAPKQPSPEEDSKKTAPKKPSKRRKFQQP